MTLVPDEPNDLTDEALRWIGVIAVESARLEWGLAGLLATVEDIDQQAALDVRNREKLTRIIRGLAERPPWSGASDDTERWARRAVELLRLRGALMHSTWIVGEGGFTMSHLRSGAQTPIDPTAPRALAEDIRNHAGMFAAVWFAAMPNLFEP